MGMTGFICHDDYYDRLKRLTNEEVGNLFRQLMLYHAGRLDEMSDFIENEGIAFDFIASDIDRMEEKRSETSETNRSNGLKGGRPKKRTEPIETEQNRQKPTETEQNPAKPYKDKDKDIYKDKDNNNPPIPPFVEDEDAKAIQSEQNRVLTAAEDAGFPKNNTVRAQLIALYAEQGLEKMLDGIKECATHSASSIAYLSAVLKGTKKRSPPKVNAQAFPQRDYSDAQDKMMSDLEKEIAEMRRNEQ
jgi:hypothetical protein